MKNVNNLCESIIDAYADCNKLTKATRNLKFRSGMFVSRQEAFDILSRAIPGGYNNFEAKLVFLLPEDVVIDIAREGSVCLYVGSSSNITNLSELMVDEFDEISKGVYRLWWD